MKAAVYYENGGPEVLKYEDVPDPKCHPKGIVIRVEAISIEGGDTLNRHRGTLVTRPHVVGYQAAGEIIEVGSEVKNLRVGQKVATSNAYGSHAELRAVPARACWVIPDGFDVKKAAVIPVTFGTADDCLFEFGHLKAGETVLIQAGASGVGVAAIQLAKRAGAKVFATASSDERLNSLRPLGLDNGINYVKDDVVESVMKLTDGKGVNLVVDSVGGSTLQGSILSLGYRGRVSMVGRAGREPMTVDVSTLMGGNRTLQGVFLGAEIATDRAYNNIQRLINDAAKGELKIIIDKTFPLKEAAAAHAYIESRKAVGRVLMIPVDFVSEPAGPVEGRPDDKLREAIQGPARNSGLLRRYAPRNDEAGVIGRTIEPAFRLRRLMSCSACGRDGPRHWRALRRSVRMPVRARSFQSLLLGAASLIVLSATAASAEDFDASRLPRLPDAKVVYSGAPVTNYTVPGNVGDAADAVNKLMLAEHWQPYLSPFSSNPKLTNFMVTRFKKGTIAMEVDVSVAPAMANATYVAYTGLINENDLPFPTDASDIQFDSARPYLSCTTAASIDDMLKFFTTELASRGWMARPENAKPDRKSDKGAYATFTASENRGLFLTLRRGDDNNLKIEIRAIPADAIGAKPDEIATVAPLPQSPEQRAEAEAAKNRARMDQAKRDEARAEADAIVAKAQQIARDTIAQANKDAQSIKDSAAASAPKSPAGAAVDAASQAAANSALPIPMPDGATDVDYNAADGKLEFNSTSSVKALAAFYRSSLKALGWKEDPTPINKPNMVALDFNKGDKDLSFTIMQLGKSVNVDASGSGLVTATAKPDTGATASQDNASETKSGDRITSADKLEAEESGGLPVPTEHTMSAGDQSPFRHQLQASIPASLDAVLGFYRRELTKRGWKEDAQSASIKSDTANVPFTSPTGPSVLKLARKDGETTVELAVRDKDAAEKAGMLPKAGQVKLLLGNTLPADATITINNQTVKIPAGAGSKGPASGPQLELPPGTYKFSLKMAGKATASDQIVVAADETWGLLIGPGGALPLQMY